MEELAAALSAWPVAEAMRTARWGYAAVSTAHVLGLALLVGAIAALDLRLMGLWRDTALAPLARVLPPVASAGLALAAVSGGLLFLAGPADYLSMRLFGVKIGLVLLGAAHAVWVHAGAGPAAAGWRVGAVSLAIWLAVLVCGRMLAFVD